MRNLNFIAFSLVLVLFCISVRAQTAAFTFQGQLSNSGTPANGNHDFEFALFDGVAGGTQLGSTISLNGVAVTSGIFSVTLDFGSQFPGANRFLEIRLRSAGSGTFTTLSPRQAINSTPYSLKSLTADTATTAATATNAMNAVNASNATTATNFTGTLTGDVTGTQAATSVARLQSRSVANTAPLDGQVLKFNAAASEWRPDTDNTGTSGGGGTITGVTPGTGLSGGGATGNVTLNIANGGVGTAQLADSAVTDAKIASVSGAKVTGAVANSTNAVNATTSTNALSLGGVVASGYLQTNGNGSGLTNLNASSLASGTLSNSRLGQIPTANIADAAVTGPKIALGQVVKGLNTLTDNVTLAAGSNITITPSGNTLTIASTAAGGCPSPCTSAIFNATQQYNFGGNRVLAAPGSNTFLGVTAGTNNTSGILNSFFGAGSGEANTTGIGNSFFGGGSGQESVTGSDNSFFGGNTGRGNTSGSRNSFFGRLAGRFSTAGSDNTFVGYNAGNNNASGGNNTLVGSGAGENNTGSQNSFFGFNAGAGNTTGIQNSFFGDNAGLANTAPFNSFFGRRSGVDNTTGNSNSFFGIFSGDSNTTGNRNVFFGANAGEANTTGNDNTIIGADANVGSGSLTNATAIGRLAEVNTSNSLVLGSVSPATNVGIGTSSPTNRLTIGTPEATVAGSPAVGVYGAGTATMIIRDTTNDIEGLFGVNSSGVIVSAMTNHDLQLRTGNLTRLRVLANGTVNVGGVQGDDPSLLSVNGTIATGYGNGGSMHLCQGASNVISFCGSSRRYKENIQPFVEGLALIQRLRPVTFDWKHNSIADLGVVAEEVAEIEPLLITHNAKGEIEGVKYDRIAVILVNAVKEQQAQIDAQRKLIYELQTQLKSLAVAKREKNKWSGKRRATSR